MSDVMTDIINTNKDSYDHWLKEEWTRIASILLDKPLNPVTIGDYKDIKTELDLKRWAIDITHESKFTDMYTGTVTTKLEIKRI